MKLKKANRWLTLASNVGVMAGIIFLGYEMQQNTLATQLEAATNFQGSYSDIEATIYENPEFAALLLKGRENEPVDGAGQLRLGVFYGNVLRQWQFNHYQYLSGALSDEIWAGNVVFMGQIVREDIGLRRHWQTSQDMFSPAFNEMLASVDDRE